MTFEVNAEAIGVVMIWYLKSKTFGLGDLKCWVTTWPTTPQIFEGYWEDNT